MFIRNGANFEYIAKAIASLMIIINYVLRLKKKIDFIDRICIYSILLWLHTLVIQIARHRGSKGIASEEEMKYTMMTLAYLKHFSKVRRVVILSFL